MTTYREQRHRVMMAIQGVRWKQEHQWRGPVERIPDPCRTSLTLWRCRPCGEWTSSAKPACRTCGVPRE